MNELEMRRRERRRKRLIAAVVTRFVWITTGFILFYFTELPLRSIFLYALAAHFTLNGIVLVNFHFGRLVDLATLVVISGDVAIISLGVLITGGVQSPFILVLPVVVSLTILLADSFKGYYIAALSSLLYGLIGFAQHKQMFSGYVDLKNLEPITIIFYLLFASGALFSIAILMSFVMKKIETSEENLFNRGEELQNSLAEINALKTQQDGDYFLTSLLIDTLQVNNAKSDRVKVQHLTKQKKTFKFKRYQKELGGDLCISHRILLRGKPHILFLNADAMGKSMQGAGGALVLGSVFQAQIERIKASHDVQTQFPERFIGNVFLDLQKVFESFEGSMLISLILGLIDEETGLLYFVNAEHPHLVLYRDKKATFLIAANDYKKAGTPGYNQAIAIETFNLENDDLLVLGSDGRDDLVIGSDEQGKRLINHDENQFLQLVEEANGELNDIYKLVIKSGEIIDDISLMSLHFTSTKTEPITSNGSLLLQARAARKAGNFAEAIKQLRRSGLGLRHNYQLWRELIINYSQAKQLAKAARHLRQFLQRFPNDNEMIYLYSYCLKKLGLYQQAADWGQRVYFRDQSHIRNSLNLAKTYSALKNQAQVKKLLAEILEQSELSEKERKLALAMQSKLALY